MTEKERESKSVSRVMKNCESKAEKLTANKHYSSNKERQAAKGEAAYRLYCKQMGFD